MVEKRKKGFLFILAEEKWCFMQEKNNNLSELSEEERNEIAYSIATTFSDFSYLYNKTGFVDGEGKVVGTITEKGLELIACLHGKKKFGIPELIQLRYELWFEYTQMLLYRCNEVITNIFSNFGKAENDFVKLKEYEETLSELVPPQADMVTNGKEINALFENLLKFSKDLEKHEGIQISEGKTKYFFYRFLPLETIFSVSYFGLLSGFSTHVAKWFGGEIQIVHFIGIFVVWFIISFILFCIGKAWLKPKL